jgi:hypothetical protein
MESDDDQKTNIREVGLKKERTCTKYIDPNLKKLENEVKHTTICKYVHRPNLMELKKGGNIYLHTSSQFVCNCEKK